MKLIFLFLLSFAFANSLTFKGLRDSRFALKLMYNGLFGEVELENPTTVLDCYDDDSAPLTFHFLATLFKQMVNNNVVGIEKTVQLFKKTVSPALAECLNTNPEMIKARALYGIPGLGLTQIQEVILAYAMIHPVPFHQSSLELDSNYNGGNFEKVGQVGGVLLKKAFGKNTTMTLEVAEKPLRGHLKLQDPSRYLFQFFQGLWRQAGLPDPISPINCFNSEAALDTLEYIEELSEYLAYNNFVPLNALTENFLSEVPQDVLKCWNEDPQVQAMEEAYRISEMKVKQIQAKIATYAASHYQDFHRIASRNNDNFQAYRFVNVGTGYGELLKNAITK